MQWTPLDVWCVYGILSLSFSLSLSLTHTVRPRSYSNSSDGQTPPLTPPISPDVKVRSSSLTQLDRQSLPLTHQSAPPPVMSPLATQSYSYNREHVMDALNIFNWHLVLWNICVNVRSCVTFVTFGAIPHSLVIQPQSVHLWYFQLYISFSILLLVPTTFWHFFFFFCVSNISTVWHVCMSVCTSPWQCSWQLHCIFLLLYIVQSLMKWLLFVINSCLVIWMLSTIGAHALGLNGHFKFRKVCQI